MENTQKLNEALLVRYTAEIQVVMTDSQLKDKPLRDKMLIARGWVKKYSPIAQRADFQAVDRYFINRYYNNPEDLFLKGIKPIEGLALKPIEANFEQFMPLAKKINRPSFFKRLFS